MQAFLIAVAVVGGVIAVAAVALLPLRMGWSHQVRWLVAAHASGYAAGPYATPLDLREVTVTAVERRGEHLELGVLEAGHPASHTIVLRTNEPPLDDQVAMLREWSVLQTPMLLFVDQARGATLSGPIAAMSGLWRVEVSTVDRGRAVS